jgi:ribosomal protein S18 acetylase RimI-like enzyme
MPIETQSVLEYGLSKTAAVLNLGFSDYFVPIQLNLSSFSDLMRIGTIDLALSKVALRNDKAVGAALIARRGWSSRLAAMSIIPEARGQKVGLSLVNHLVEEAKDRGDQRMELEVITQNEPAVKLYQKVGFQTIRRLFGYKIEAPRGETAELEEIDLRELSKLVNIYGVNRLPWQLSGEDLAAKGPPYRAYKLGAAFVAITNPDAEGVVIYSILTLPRARGQNQASDLLRALFAAYPGKTWSIPAIYPEEFDPFFEKLGFEKQTLSQFQMELNFK